MFKYVLTASGSSGAKSQQELTVEVLPGPIAYEFDVDRPDQTWNVEVLNVGTLNHHACDEPCLRRPDCKGYVYIKPGFGAPHGRCILKSELPKPQFNRPCCASGLVTKYLPTPVPPPPPPGKPGS